MAWVDEILARSGAAGGVAVEEPRRREPPPLMSPSGLESAYQISRLRAMQGNAEPERLDTTLPMLGGGGVPVNLPNPDHRAPGFLTEEDRRAHAAYLAQEFNNPADRLMEAAAAIPEDEVSAWRKAKGVPRSTPDAKVRLAMAGDEVFPGGVANAAEPQFGREFVRGARNVAAAYLPDAIVTEDIPAVGVGGALGELAGQVGMAAATIGAGLVTGGAAAAAGAGAAASGLASAAGVSAVSSLYAAGRVESELEDGSSIPAAVANGTLQFLVEAVGGGAAAKIIRAIPTPTFDRIGRALLAGEMGAAAKLSAPFLKTGGIEGAEELIDLAGQSMIAVADGRATPAEAFERFMEAAPAAGGAGFALGAAAGVGLAGAQAGARGVSRMAADRAAMPRPATAPRIRQEASEAAIGAMRPLNAQIQQARPYGPTEAGQPAPEVPDLPQSDLVPEPSVRDYAKPKYRAPISRAEALVPETVQKWAEENPEHAGYIAAKEAPTRADFTDVGIAGKWEAAERAKLAADLREYRGELPPDTRIIMPEKGPKNPAKLDAIAEKMRTDYERTQKAIARREKPARTQPSRTTPPRIPRPTSPKTAPARLGALYGSLESGGSTPRHILVDDDGTVHANTGAGLIVVPKAVMGGNYAPGQYQFNAQGQTTQPKVSETVVPDAIRRVSAKPYTDTGASSKADALFVMASKATAGAEGGRFGAVELVRNRDGSVGLVAKNNPDLQASISVKRGATPIAEVDGPRLRGVAKAMLSLGATDIRVSVSGSPGGKLGVVAFTGDNGVRAFLPGPIRSADTETETDPDTGGGPLAMGSRGGGTTVPRNIEVSTGNTGKKAPNIPEIVATAETLFKVPVRYDRLHSRVASGLYYPQDWMVRLKTKNNRILGTLTHEVAHHIDNTAGLFLGGKGKVANQARNAGGREALAELRSLDYEPKKRRAHEGFAEFMRLYLTTDGEAEKLAPQFFAHFEKNILPNIKGLDGNLKTMRRLIDQWRDAGSKARVRAQIGVQGKVPGPRTGNIVRNIAGRVSEAFHAAVQDFVNQAHTLGRVEKASGGKGVPATAHLSLKRVAPVYARRALLGDGIPDPLNPLRSLGDSLSARLERHGITTKNEDDFKVFWFALHAREVHRKGGQPGITPLDAETVYKDLHTPEFEAAAKSLTAYANELIEVLRRVDAISDDTAETVKKHWTTYMPLFRVVEESGSGGSPTVSLPDALQRRSGSVRQIIDPLESLAIKTVRTYERAFKQIVINELHKAAHNVGGMGKFYHVVPPIQTKRMLDLRDIKGQLTDLIGEIDPAAAEAIETLVMEAESEGVPIPLEFWRPDFSIGGKNIVRLHRGGKPILAEVDPLLFDALDLFLRGDMQASHPLNKAVGWALRTSAQLQRLGATGANPDFTGLNTIRDFLTYSMQTKQPMVSADPTEAFGLRAALGPIEMAVRAAAHHAPFIKYRDPYVGSFIDAGGSMNSLLGLDRNSIRTAAAELTRPGVARRLRAVIGSTNPLHIRAGQFAGGVLDLVRDAVSWSDLLPRMAEYRYALKRQGVSAADIRAGQVSMRQMMIAQREAAEVTVPFKRIGAHPIVRTGNTVVPFLNATIQGPTQMLVRASEVGPQFWIKALGLASASALYYLANRDEDWYKEQPDWLRYGFWTITDDDGTPTIRVPRSLDWGWYIASATEAMLAQWDKEDPDGFRNFAEAFMARMAPNLLPPWIGIGLDLKANTDPFRRAPIVPERLEALPAAQQQTEDTTALARLTGEAFNLSPIQIDYALSQATGGTSRRLERYAKAATDAVAGEPVDPRGIPFIGAFPIVRHYGRSVDDFYTAKEANDRAYAGERAKIIEAAQGDLSAAQVTAQVSEPVRRKAYRDRMIAELLSSLRAERDKLATDAEKREADERMTGLARYALDRRAIASFRAPFDPGLPESGAVEDWLYQLVAAVSAKSHPNADEAAELLRRAGISDERLGKIVRQWARDNYKTPTAQNEYRTRFWRHYRESD